MRFLLLCLAACGLAFGTARADQPMTEPDFKDFSELSLDELLAVELEVASRGQARPLREAPGVLSVVTREDIERSGARDLVDILMSIPGFQFGTDTYSSVFPGVRGLWAADGKLLVLLDGHDLSERMYASFPLGNRIPVDWIERVEVIRGPGSVLYGGSAELAVVNVITRQAADLQGLHLAGAYGQMLHGVAADGLGLGDTFGRRTLSLQWGQRFPAQELSARLAVFAGQGNRSDRDYTDALGERYQMAGQADADPLMASLAVDWRGLEFGYLFERYHTSQRDGWGQNQAEALGADFTTSSLRLAYAWTPLDGLRIRPALTHVWQKPWETTDERARAYEDVFWEPELHEIRLGLSAEWTPLQGTPIVERLSFLAGLDYTYLWARDEEYGFADPEDGDTTLNALEFHNVAAFLEGRLDTPWLNATAGLRLEYHSRFGTSIVPRGVLQKVHGPFHWKALVSQAFRAPSVMNLAYTPDVVPEKTTVFELELGLQPLAGLMLTLSGFDITIDRPIIYFWDEAIEQEGYRNWAQTGTRGLEAEVRYQRGIWAAVLQYSFYDVVGKNRVDTFRVPGARHVLLGMAPHKASLRGRVRILENLSLHLGLTFLSDQRWAYGPQDAEGNATLVELPALWLLDVYLRYDHVFTRGLWLGLGGYNLLDRRIEYAQPYDNGHPPLPGPSLEVLVRLGYDLPLE
jgi:outer membrane receptor protein involved in Fe transport